MLTFNTNHSLFSYLQKPWLNEEVRVTAANRVRPCVRRLALVAATST